MVMRGPRDLEEMLLQRLRKLWGEAALLHGPEALCRPWSLRAVAPCFGAGAEVGWCEALTSGQPGSLGQAQTASPQKGDLFHFAEAPNPRQAAVLEVLFPHNVSGTSIRVYYPT